LLTLTLCACSAAAAAAANALLLAAPAKESTTIIKGHPALEILTVNTQAWAARYNTWLVIKLTPKGVVFSFLFFSKYPGQHPSHSFIHSFIHSFLPSFLHSFIHSFIHSLDFRGCWGQPRPFDQ